MIIKAAKRTESVQEYYFSKKLKEIAAMNAERAARGEELIINLGIGSPDGMPPMSAIDALCDSARQAGSHAYQSYVGLPELRQAFADWYMRWYGVELDPKTEIQPLVGSKEAVLLISMAFLDKGDKVLVPDPGYPTYSSASKLAEAEVVPYDLCEENGWWPDFEVLERMDLSGVKIMWTNYPNMPTGAAASEELYAKLVDFGRRHGILICNDNPYSFILNDRPLSILAQPGAKECCLELNSLSKAHNMAGWRIGMVAAEPEIISEILKVKSQMDSGMFKPLQVAAVEALSQGPEWFAELNAEYARRRVLAGEIFDLIGAEYDHDSSGMFLWGRVDQPVVCIDPLPLCEWAPPPTRSRPQKLGNFRGPRGWENANSDHQADRLIVRNTSVGERISERLLREAGVFITPGFIFGKNGEDYIRISLCAKPEVLKRAAEKIKNVIRKD